MQPGLFAEFRRPIEDEFPAGTIARVRVQAVQVRASGALGKAVDLRKKRSLDCRGACLSELMIDRLNFLFSDQAAERAFTGRVHEISNISSAYFSKNIRSGIRGWLRYGRVRSEGIAQTPKAVLLAC